MTAQPKFHANVTDQDQRPRYPPRLEGIQRLGSEGANAPPDSAPVRHPFDAAQKIVCLLRRDS